MIKRLHLNKYELLLMLIFITSIVSGIIIILNNLNNEIIIEPEVRFINMNLNQISNIDITIYNKTLKNLNANNNSYLSYQIIDNNNNIIFDKKNIVPLKIPFLSKNQINLPLTYQLGYGTHTMKLYISSSNISNSYDTTIKIANIPNLNNQNIFITTQKNEIETNNKNHIKIPIKIVNDSIFTLYNDFNISYHIYNENNELIKLDGTRYKLKKNISPGEKLEETISITEDIFTTKGTYILEIDLVQENVCWLSDFGLKTAKVNIIAN